MSKGRNQHSWKKDLDPYARVIAELHQMVGNESDEGLDRLEAAIQKPTMSNCWWATYRAAEALRSLIPTERRVRAWRANADSESSR